MRLFILTVFAGIYTIYAYKYGNVIKLDELETYDDAIDALENNEFEYNRFIKLKKDLDKFINFNDYKCYTINKIKCLINEDIYEQINFLNETIRNEEAIATVDKKRFSTYVDNLKSINYIHYTYSSEFVREENDQFFDEYQSFPVELFSYVGYFRYKQDPESIIKISNYLDQTRHHAKNIIDKINIIKEKLDDFNPETRKNYVLNYRNIKKRKNVLWWNDVYNYWFD